MTMGFQLEYASSGGPDPAALGPWRTQPTVPTASDVVFGTISGVPPPRRDDVSPEWRAALPEDPQSAEATLQEAETALRTASIALPQAFRRLEVFARPPAEVTTFAVAQPQGVAGQPEAELAELLGLHRQADEITFDIRPPSQSAWQPLIEAFHAFLDRVTMALAPRASVKTRIGDAFVAWTVVRWPSGLVTLQREGSRPDDARLHQRAVRLALHTRAIVLRTLTVVVRGASVLMSAVATPIGPLLALPAAWKLINDVQAAFRPESAA